MIKGKKKKANRSTVGLSTLDGFLRDQDKLEDFQAVAINEVLTWQIKGTIPPVTVDRDRRD